MKKVFVIYSMSKVKGSNEPLNHKSLWVAFENQEIAEKNCKRLNEEKNKDIYLEFHYFIEPIILF